MCGNLAVHSSKNSFVKSVYQLWGVGVGVGGGGGGGVSLLIQDKVKMLSLQEPAVSQEITPRDQASHRCIHPPFNELSHFNVQQDVGARCW